MGKYRVTIKSARPVVVEADDDREAFNIAFEETEWDYDIEKLEATENECEDDSEQ